MKKGLDVKKELDNLLLESEAAISEVRFYHSLGAAARLETLARDIQTLLGGDVLKHEEKKVREEESELDPFGFGI